MLYQDELDEVASVWNSHRIRPSKNATVAFGQPNSMYMVPEMWGTYDYICHTDENEILACLPLVATPSLCICDEDVYELCCDIMRTLHLNFPSETWELVTLYEDRKSVV